MLESFFGIREKRNTSTPEPDMTANDKLVDISPIASLQPADISNCAKCLNPFSVFPKSDKMDSLGCSFCDLWICTKCFLPDLTTVGQRLAAMNTLSRSSVDIHCGICEKPKLSDLVKELKSSKDQINILAQTVRELQQKVANPALGAPVATDFQSPHFIHMIASAALEISDRRDKRLNLVFVGIPETPDNPGVIDQQMAADASNGVLVPPEAIPPVNPAPFPLFTDRQVVADICNSLSIPLESVSRVFRDGERVPNRSRILKVMFTSGSDRQTVLRNGTRLLQQHRAVVGARFKPFVRPDLTFLERQEDAQLQETVKQRRDGGEDVVVYKGKVWLRADRDLERSKSKRGQVHSPKNLRQY